VLINPSNANAKRDAATVQEAARAIGLEILCPESSDENDFEAVFTTLVRERAGALLKAIFPRAAATNLLRLAARDAVPAIYAWREYPAAGGPGFQQTSSRALVRAYPSPTLAR
jgi:putative tryptophan/tyrosine transport system substrate-binding protein